MRTSENIAELAAALAKAQGAIKNAAKESEPTLDGRRLGGGVDGEQRHRGDPHRQHERDDDHHDAQDRHQVADHQTADRQPAAFLTRLLDLRQRDVAEHDSQRGEQEGEGAG